MASKRVRLRIYGMTCDDCVVNVTNGLKENDGVGDVQIFLKDGTGYVEVDPEKVKPEELLKSRVFSKASHYKATLMDQ